NDVSVVSMPSFELFEIQSSEYKESVLPKSVKIRVAIEAAASFGWELYVGTEGATITIDHFGASEPGTKILEEFGFT
ncbi:transketolase, partial [Enterococcus faecium]|uniref:transketolase-like TK C-terminal-containing protein n=1 Tax=Enterococcus faecium TaxID=1352 RepID=UPI0011388569